MDAGFSAVIELKTPCPMRSTPAQTAPSLWHLLNAMPDAWSRPCCLSGNRGDLRRHADPQGISKRSMS